MPQHRDQQPAHQEEQQISANEQQTQEQTGLDPYGAKPIESFYPEEQFNQKSPVNGSNEKSIVQEHEQQ